MRPAGVFRAPALFQPYGRPTSTPGLPGGGRGAGAGAGEGDGAGAPAAERTQNPWGCVAPARGSASSLHPGPATKAIVSQGVTLVAGRPRPNGHSMGPSG